MTGVQTCALPIFVIPFALADIHVYTIHIDDGVGGDAGTRACPSNFYDCNYFTDLRHSEAVLPGPFDGQHNVAILSGLCNMGQLNLFINSDGTWSMYVDKGNGTIVGTCYPNTANTTCHSAVYKTIVDKLVCYTNICD